MKKLIVFCTLLAACSEQQLNAFTEALSKPEFVVHFGFNVYALNDQNRHQLDSIISLLKADNRAVQKLEISGFCDSIGSNAYNESLSVKRAGSVRSYLVSKGLQPSLITGVKGYGKSQPLNDNRTEADRAGNRRVEILIQLKPPVKSELRVDSIKEKQASPSDSVVLPTMDISRAQVNDIIQVPDINFYPDRHMIVQSSLKALHTLLNTMRVNKTLRIEIRGHICCTPGYQGDAMDIDTYTEDLSLQRAKEIYLYLSENGIARDRMTYVGFGGRYPLVKEFTDHDKAVNRRVEIKILDK